MKFVEAKNISDRVIEAISPYCDICLVAGSIRRQKPDVGDIEVVAIARTIEGHSHNLFSTTTFSIVDPKFTSKVNSLGEIIKGNSQGRYMQITLPERINLDLFLPDRVDFWRQYAIRTGSAEYAQKFIASAWRRKGWCGSDKGLRKMVDCEKIPTPDKKGKWKCVNPNAELPPAWTSEKDFYLWAGIDYIEPKYRK